MSVSAPDHPSTSTSASAPEGPQAGWPLGPSLVILLGLAGVAALGVRGWTPPFARVSGTVLQGTAGWTVVSVATGVTLLLILVALLGTGSWRYVGGTDRDERLDLVRGVAICFVVLNHINMPSLFQLVTQETLAPVSGAELFVALSGVVLGIVYRRRLQQIDLLSATGALWQRAGKLYKTSLLVVVTVFLVTLVPGVDGTVVRNFVDQRTGQTYGLYPNMERLLDYPVPGFVLRDILLLRLGPYQFNILGLYVVLLLVSPLLIAALRRRLWWLALLSSWALYVLNTLQPITVLKSQFEDPFPLLSWQLLFVHGMVAGWYWPRLLAWAGRGWGKAVVVLAVLGSLALAVFSWNNPFLSNGYDVRLALIPDAQFLALYENWFLRPTLGPGRVLATGLLLVTLYALLTAYWRPLRAAVGWFLIPLGQASLYVFVLQVFFALIVANVPGLGGANVLLNTVAHALVLVTIWLMVRHRFLFSVIPR